MAFWHPATPSLSSVYHFVFPLGCGTNNQLMVMAAIKPTRMGCVTDTLVRAPRTPVRMGKTDPPIWAKTNTNEMAVALISMGNSWAPTERPWQRQS